MELAQATLAAAANRVKAISARHLCWAAVALGAAFAALVYYRIMRATSIDVDGIRYFWLDDDMMISMRYARNLAEGAGLVWNPGEPVEGYTNFLWTVIMAGVHMLGFSDAKASLAIHGITFSLVVGIAYFTVQLVRSMVPNLRGGALVAVACIVTCGDIMYWATAGFESVLVAFLHLFFLNRLFRHNDDPIGYVALALIPLVRADGLHIFAANAALVLLLSQNRRRTVACLAITLVPVVAHFAFRQAYYGEWLPNTYYLKVGGVADKHWLGWLYTRRFLIHYAVPLALALGACAALFPTNRRAVALLTTVGATGMYSVLVGGDMFGSFRFFCHVVPVVFAFAVAGAVVLTQTRVARATWYAVLLLSSVPLTNTLGSIASPGDNGKPRDAIVAATALRKNAQPTSTIAVVAAGIVPYFSRLRALDILGKNDKHIARLAPVPGAPLGHGKLDPTYTLTKEPDFVVTMRSHGAVHAASSFINDANRATQYDLVFVTNDLFRTHYLKNVVRATVSHKHTIYTWPGSAEYGNHHHWVLPRLDKPRAWKTKRSAK